MNKKLLSSVVAASMLALPAFNSAQAVEKYETVGIVMDGVTKNFSQPAIVYHDITLVPLRDIFETLGVEVKWDDATQKVTAIKGNDIVELKIGAKQAFKNYQPIALSQEAMVINDRTMVPLRFVSESFGAKVDWDSKTKTVKIATAAEQTDAGTVNGGSTTQGETGNGNSSQAAGTQTQSSGLPTLTIAQAVEKAITNSSKIRKAEVSIDQYEERRDKASDNLEYTPIGNGSGAGDEAIRTAFTGLQMADLNLQSGKKQLEIAKETLTYQVKDAYNKVIQAEKKLALTAKELELAKVQNSINKQKATLGLISAADKVTADNSLIQTEKQYQTDADALKKAYETLNHLVGNSLDKRFNLVDVPKYTEPLADDVDYQVAKVMSDSKTIWLAEEQVRLAKLGLDLYVFNSKTEQDTYTSKGMEIDKAEYDLAQSKKDLESGIRQTYHTIKNLENSYEVLKTNLINLEQTQRIVKARYDLGMVPLVNLMEANVGVEKIKQQMFDIEAQLETLKMTYEKPWVATGAGM